MTNPQLANALAHFIRAAVDLESFREEVEVAKQRENEWATQVLLHTDRGTGTLYFTQDENIVRVTTRDHVTNVELVSSYAVEAVELDDAEG